MASVGPALLIFLLTTVATVAAAGGYLASETRRGTARDTRKAFLLGFGCGWLARGLLRGRHRLQRALAVTAWRLHRDRRWVQLRCVATTLVTSARSHIAPTAPRALPVATSRRRPAVRHRRHYDDRRPPREVAARVAWLAATCTEVWRRLPIAKFLQTQRF